VYFVSMSVIMLLNELGILESLMFLSISCIIFKAVFTLHTASYDIGLCRTMSYDTHTVRQFACKSCRTTFVFVTYLPDDTERHHDVVRSVNTA